MVKRRLGCRLGSVGAAFLILFAASSAASDSLFGALTDAYQLNRQIKAERAAVKGKDELVPEAKSNLWRPHVFFQPQANVTRMPETIKDTFKTNRGVTSQSFTENNDSTTNDRLLAINTTMNIFDSGLTANQLLEAKALINAERGILQQTEEQVFQEVATQYGQIVLNQLLAQYSLEIKQDTERLRIPVKALQQAHFLTVTAVSQVEGQYQSAVAAYEQTMGAARAARAQFLAVVGRPAGDIGGWPKLEPMPRNLDDGLKIALNENPQLFSARAELAAAQAAVAVAKAQLLPVLSVSGLLSRDWSNAHFLANNPLVPGALPPHFTNTNSASASIGVHLSMPLYQGGGEYANVRQQIDAVEQNQSIVINTEFTIRGAVESAWQTLEAARAQVRAATAQVAAEREAFAGLTRQFTEGTETITDVLTEERNLNSALMTEAQAGYSYFTAVVAFQVAIGRFTAKDLHLPVQLYDPLDHYRAVKDKLIGFGPD